MRIFLRIISIVFAAVIGLLAIAFLFINGRLLFSGDIAVYTSPVTGVFATVFNVLKYLFILASAVLFYISLLRRNGAPTIRLWALSFAIADILIFGLTFLDGLKISSGVDGYLSYGLRFSLLIFGLSFVINYIFFEGRRESER